MPAVLAEITHPDKLEPVAGFGIGEGGFELAVLQRGEGIRVQIVEVVGPLGHCIDINEREQILIEHDVRVYGVCRTDPVDGSTHLAPVRGVAVTGFKVGSAAQFDDIAFCIFHDLFAFHQVSAHQTDLPARFEPLELGRRDRGKVALFNPHLPCKGHLPGSGVGVLRVVAHLKVFGLAFGVVGDDHL